MHLFALFIILAMTCFAVLSARREILLYKRSLKEEMHLISRARRNRRLLISFVLLLEAVLLFAGFYLVQFANPLLTLLFWIPPLCLVFVLIYLSMQDFKQTTRELDILFKEAHHSIIKKMENQKPS